MSAAQIRFSWNDKISTETRWRWKAPSAGFYTHCLKRHSSKALHRAEADCRLLNDVGMLPYLTLYSERANWILPIKVVTLQAAKIAFDSFTWRGWKRPYNTNLTLKKNKRPMTVLKFWRKNLRWDDFGRRLSLLREIRLHWSRTFRHLIRLWK